MKLFRWNLGRQNAGYKTLPFFISKWFDLYLLKYEVGDGIGLHSDLTPGRKHYRINIIIWNSAIGGKFNCQNMIYESSRIKIFRPDINTHSVDKILSGKRLVLLIGWCIIDTNVGDRHA